MRVLISGSAGEKVGALAYSPDSSRLAAVGTIPDDADEAPLSPHLGIYHPTEGRMLVHKSITSGPGRCVAYTPDGNQLAIGNGRNHILVCNAESGETLRRLARMRTTAVTVAYSPDGRQLLAGSADRGSMSLFGELSQYECPEYAQLSDLRSESVHGIGFPADGSFFAVATGRGSIQITNASGKVSKRYRLNMLIRDMAVSRDGRFLAAGIGHRVWVCDRQSNQMGTHGRWSKSVDGVAFSPDSRRLAIAVGDGVVRFWECGTWNEEAAFEWGFESVRCVAFSPDGMTCAAGGKGDAALVIWDVEA